jgi:alanine dehydrogenase
MKPYSVIIDVAIDRGGNFETSELTNHDNPVFKKHGVLHYCVPNIPSRVSRTASYALSNIFTPMIDEMVKDGGFSNSLRNHAWIRKGTYLFNGNLTNKSLADKFQLKYRDLDLLVGLFN